MHKNKKSSGHLYKKWYDYKRHSFFKGEIVMIKVGIIGATGYAGGELVRILQNHKEARIIWYGSKSYIDKK